MTDIYITRNSAYTIDLANRRYMRSAIREQSVVSEKLIYGEWLPLKDVENPVTLEDSPGQQFKAPELRAKSLRILHEASTRGILTTDVLEILHDVDESQLPA